MSLNYSENVITDPFEKLKVRTIEFLDEEIDKIHFEMTSELNELCAKRTYQGIELGELVETITRIESLNEALRSLENQRVVSADCSPHNMSIIVRDKYEDEY